MVLFLATFFSHSHQRCRSTHAQSGQAGLVVLLMTVVLMTVGVSVASRSTTQVTISRQEEESNQVLNAAEAGVEQALSEDFAFAGEERSSSLTVDGNTVNYVVQKMRTLETQLFEGVTAQITLPTVSSNQTLQVLWQKQCDPDPASVLVTVYNLTGGNYSARTFAYNSACASTPAGNGFSSTSASGGYQGAASVTIQPGDLYARIKPLYANTDVLVSGAGGLVLPEQYFKIRSSATNAVGSEERVVEVNRTLPVAPAFMDYTIYSGTSITTN